MKLAKITAEHRRKIDVAPRKTVWMAIATSVLFHAVGFAAMVAWPSIFTSFQVRFAGREQAFPLTLTIAQPQWNVDPTALDSFETSPPVVIEPNKARIGKHTYVQAPTVELSADDFLLNPPIDVTEPLSKLATLDEAYAMAEPLDLKTETIEHPRQTNPQPSNLAIATPSSSLGNTKEIPPDLSENTPPTYPTHAIQNGWEGIVLLRIWIDATGHITKAEVARTSGYRILDGAAATAVRQWNAKPASRGGKPVSTVKLLPVRFKL